MAQRGRRSNNVAVERLQITLQKTDVELLDRVVRLRRYGRNRNEAAAAVIANWLDTRLQAELTAYLDRNERLQQIDKLLPPESEEAT